MKFAIFALLAALLATFSSGCGSAPAVRIELPLVTDHTTRPGEPMCPDCKVFACAAPGAALIHGVVLDATQAKLDSGVSLTSARLSAWNPTGASDTVIVDAKAMQSAPLSLAQTDFPSMTADRKIWETGEAELIVKYTGVEGPDGVKWTLPVSLSDCK